MKRKEITRKKIVASRSTNCPECGNNLIPSSGCSFCPACGYSPCL